ncbi:MAG TPA: hypothetical protein VGP30_02850, partial [Candidatus Limnocylindrales bacterium]|nr:hypothetical protein [Candidatus Limnocylindrales bacterium]
PTLVRVNVRLSATSLDFWVDVRLRSFGGRWIAIAEIAGEQEVGTAMLIARIVRTAGSPRGEFLLSRAFGGHARAGFK